MQIITNNDKKWISFIMHMFYVRQIQFLNRNNFLFYCNRIRNIKHIEFFSTNNI